MAPEATVLKSRNVSFSTTQGSSSDDGSMSMSTTFTTEILLDPEVLRALCTRGRRRFRDMKASTQADLKLDTTRGVLQVSGSKSAAADVRKRLETVSGPCLKVSNAVWAELMRTRMGTDSSQAAIAQMQAACGCRIHIERDAKQVRLFGPKDQIAVAQKLLKDLDTMCVEKKVEVQSKYLDLKTLEAFATEFGVTLQVEETQIIILGIEGAVTTAISELPLVGDDNSNQSPPGSCETEGSKPSEMARLAIEEAISKLKVDADARNFSSPNSSCDSLPSYVEDDCSTDASTARLKVYEKQMQGAVRMKAQQQQQQARKSMVLHDPFDICQECGACGRFCVKCGQPAIRNSSLPTSCRVCGAMSFCSFCGEPTPKMKLKSGDIGHRAMPWMTPQIYQQPEQAYQQMMQFVPVGMYNGVPQMSSPEGGMVLMAPNMVPMQQFPMMTSPNGMQVTPNMMAQGTQQHPVSPSNMQVQPTTVSNGMQVSMVATSVNNVQVQPSTKSNGVETSENSEWQKGKEVYAHANRGMKYATN